METLIFQISHGAQHQSGMLVKGQLKEKHKWKITSADLSDKTESTTSFAVHVLLSFDFINPEFGGPI